MLHMQITLKVMPQISDWPIMSEADVVCMGIELELSYHYSIKWNSGKLISDMKVLIMQMRFIEFLLVEKK